MPAILIAGSLLGLSPLRAPGTGRTPSPPHAAVARGPRPDSLADTTATAVAARLTRLEAHLPALGALLAQCRARGIPTAYEVLTYTILQRFIPWGREDLTGSLPDARHIATSLEQLDQKATAALQAYLQGTQRALATPQYVTQYPRIRGSSFLGDMRWPDGRIEHDRPIFYVGYGVDYFMIPDLPNFTGFGANIMQTDIISPGTVIYKAGTVDWYTSIPDTTTVRFALDTTVAHSGTQSLRISNASTDTRQVSAAFLPLYLEPHTTYQLTAWVKGAHVHRASFTTLPFSDRADVGFGFDHDSVTGDPLPDGTYPWRRVTFSVTTGDAFFWSLAIRTAGPTDQLWIDDLRLSKVGSQANLIPDPSFEAIPRHTATGYYASTTELTAAFVPLLAVAAKHNVAVDVHIQPFNLPSFVPSNIINDPQSKAVVVAYLHALLPLIKHAPGVVSICLNNEPSYHGEGNTPAQWTTYVRQLYGDIASLNAVYGTHYRQFADVPVKPSGVAGRYDRNTFLTAEFADWHHWLADQVHQLAPTIPVHTKIQNLADGIDPALFAPFSQLSGNDSEDWSYYDVLGSLKVAPIFNSEDHLLQGAESAAQVRVTLWQGALHGRNASVVWVWKRHSEDNLLQAPEMVAAIGKTSLDLNRLAREVTAVREAPAAVAIFRPRFGDAASNNANLYVNVHGFPATYLSDAQIAAGHLRQYQLLVIPTGVPVARTTLSAVEHFVDTGGHVVTVVNAGQDSALLWDEHHQRLPPDARAHVLAKAVAVSLQLADSPPGAPPLAQQLATVGGTRVQLLDATTNQPFTYKTQDEMYHGTTWRTVPYHGRVLVSVVTGAPASRAVSLAVDGRRIARVMDLISGETMVGPIFHLTGLTPYLFSVDASTERAASPTPGH
jgi:hypothetical protein